ncbi:MAG: sensor histidine kinase [Clostridiaceae bacterium]
MIVYLFTEFFNYTLAYVVIFHAILSRSKQKWLLSIGTILIFHIFLLYHVGREATSAVSLLTMLVIPAFLLDFRERKYFLLYPYVVIGTSVVGVSMSFLLATMLGIPEHIIAEGNWYTIFCQCVQGIVLILLAGYRKLKKKDSFQVNLDRKQYMLFYIVVICLFLMLAPIQKLTEEYNSIGYINLIGLSVSVACIVLVVITIWQGIVVNREIQLKERNKENEKYIELQKEYYTHLMEHDAKMRCFRHDMKAHMIVLKAHCQNGDYKELEDYLNCVIEESAIFTVESYTGNKDVDAIIRNLIENAKVHQIKFEIIGNLPDKTRVSDYDLCTILSNLIKNAIEACEKIEEISKRNIKISLGTYNQQIFISVKNTFIGKVVKKENHLVTTKEDYKNHGIGSKNIENITNKYNGVLEYLYNEGWFIVEIII